MKAEQCTFAFYQFVHWKWKSISHAWLCVTPWPSRLLCPWDSPGKNIGLRYHSLLQGILLTQGSNPGLLHFWQILYYLSRQGSTGFRQIQNSESRMVLTLKPDHFHTFWFFFSIWEKVFSQYVICVSTLLIMLINIISLLLNF